MEPNFAVLFYFDNSIPALITRKATQRPHQAFNQVPNHVSICDLSAKLVYEFVVTGCQCRPYDPAIDSEYTKHLTLPTPEKAQAFLKSCLGIRYGWLTVVDIALCKLVPDKWLSWYKQKAKHICSWLVLNAIEKGGYVSPDYIDIQIDPVTPNDMKYLLCNYPEGVK